MATYSSPWSGDYSTNITGLTQGGGGRQESSAYKLHQRRKAAAGKGQDAQGSLAEEYQKAYDKYLGKVEGRYEDIKGKYEGRRKRALGYLKGVGKQQRKDLAKRWSGQRAEQSQYLRQRGLSGTTIAPTMEQGSLEKEGAEGRRLEADLKREHVGYDVGLQGDTLGFMERREDIGPDYGQMERLAGMQGQANAGQGYQVGASGGGIGGRPVMGWYGFGSRKTGVSSRMPGAGTWQKEPAWGQNVKPTATPAKKPAFGPQPYKKTAYNPKWLA
jgi:hypothetical protein